MPYINNHRITRIFENWRNEYKWIHPDRIPITSIRYIDFIREYNKRLLYGNDINQDGFPYRDLARYDTVDMGDVHTSPFDLIKQDHFPVEELTELHEFTYFAAKQYYSASPKFMRGIKVVNMHDVRGVESNFYCRVLHDAENACRAAVSRELAQQGNQTEEVFHQLNATLPFNETMSYQEIVITAYFEKKLSFFGKPSQFSEQIESWTEMARIKLEENNISITDLPVECLYDFETSLLEKVSLRYEQLLLPEFFSSIKGERDLQAKFARWSFCSVNAEEIIFDPKYAFLLESASEFSVAKVPKVYVHVGAPKTGSTSIQDAMAKDRAVLKDDGYYLALHGQVRSTTNDDYITDNMLVECDKLGACIWSEDERQIVVSGSGNPHAGECPSHVLPSFEDLLRKAQKDMGQVVISNEWLNRQSSETGLAKILNDEWDPEIIIYYRRFYDWMESAHFQWHFDVGPDDMKVMRGKIRFIDFIRTYCSRLLKSSVMHSPDDADLQFVELTDIAEYTWHIARRYKQVPRFKDSVKIVDFHKGDVVKLFYCDVLGAEGACRLRNQPCDGEPEPKLRTKSSTVLYDLVVGAWVNGALPWSDNESSSVGGDDSLIRWTEVMADRLKEKGLTEEDFPKECLSEREQTLLLNVSLAYEKILLPESYSRGGKEMMREDFAKAQGKSKFCSVDTDAVLSSIEWNFLFEKQRNVFVHV